MRHRHTAHRIDTPGVRFVLVDAHVLTTPVITDLNGDGGSELIVGVSYFFDEDVYDSDEYVAEDGSSVDPSKCVE